MATTRAPARSQRPLPAGSAVHRAPAERTVRSRRRVKTYGEVFTPRHMVNQMLDLVRPELETGPRFVDKTFLEPAAGDGNFLVVILQRKLHAVTKRCQPSFWPTESLFCLASIYGIELLEDNHASAKTALLQEFTAFHQRNGVNCGHRTNLYRAAEFLVETNIICGNTLTGVDAAGNAVQFSWWNRVLDTPGTVQREPFTLASLLGAGVGVRDSPVHDSYEPCRIDHVHKEVKARGGSG